MNTVKVVHYRYQFRIFRAKPSFWVRLKAALVSAAIIVVVLAAGIASAFISPALPPLVGALGVLVWMGR